MRATISEIPWQRAAAGAAVMLVVYEKGYERTLRARVGENGVVALLGVASLYGILRVSEVNPRTRNESNYRLVDARAGWNYLAQGITLHGGGPVP